MVKIWMAKEKIVNAEVKEWRGCLSGRVAATCNAGISETEAGRLRPFSAI